MLVNPHILLVGLQSSTATLGKILVLSYKTKHTFDPAIPFLCIFPREMKAHVHKKTSTECSLRFFIYPGQKLETAQESINGRMDNPRVIIT